MNGGSYYITHMLTGQNTLVTGSRGGTRSFAKLNRPVFDY